MNVKNLITRSLTGSVFLAVMIGGIWCNAYTYLLLFALLTGLTLYEYNCLMAKYAGYRLNLPLHSAAGTLFFLLLSAAGLGFIDTNWLAALPLFFLLFCVEAIFKQGEKIIESVVYPLFGYLYIVIPFASTSLIVGCEGTDALLYSPLHLLSIFVFIWVSDSAAYFFGSLFGRHRLYERISPKKSWEGSIGGAAFALLFAYGFYHFFPALGLNNWMALAVVSVVFATLGDLFESFIKRTTGVKDSGALLPGHGGMLDRFDAALFALPAAVAYLRLIG